MASQERETGNQKDFIHPELKSGEVFLRNYNARRFGLLSLKSKRKGKVAYDGIGNRQTHADWFPVFIQEDELKDVGVSLMELRRSLSEKKR